MPFKKSFPPGKYQLIVRTWGYFTQYIDFNLKNGTHLTKNIKLFRDPLANHSGPGCLSDSISQYCLKGYSLFKKGQYASSIRYLMAAYSFDSSQRQLSENKNSELYWFFARAPWTKEKKLSLLFLEQLTKTNCHDPKKRHLVSYAKKRYYARPDAWLAPFHIDFPHNFVNREMASNDLSSVTLSSVPLHGLFRGLASASCGNQIWDL